LLPMFVASGSSSGRVVIVPPLMFWLTSMSAVDVKSQGLFSSTVAKSSAEPSGFGDVNVNSG